jgi:hypothetical protein
MDFPWSHVDMASPSQVAAVLELGAEANRTARCRRGSMDVIAPPGRVVLTGDLHDNLHHLLTACERADLLSRNENSPDVPAHLTLQELIHGDSMHEGMDPSYRVLVRAAVLKAKFPEFVHLLLGNHELSQISGSGVMKQGVNCVKAFDAAIDYVFASEAAVVRTAVRTFIESMPLAMRIDRANNESWLCSHSLPSGSDYEQFDWSVLDRELTAADFAPRSGAAHRMTWGRGHTAAELEHAADALKVGQFVIGHEHAEQGWSRPLPKLLILNSDHQQGVLFESDLMQLPAGAELTSRIARINQ